MKKIALGVTLIAISTLSLPSAHALTRYADAQQLFPKEYTCWHFAPIGDNRYEQRSMTVEAFGPHQAISECVARHLKDIKRLNTNMRRA